MDKNNTDFPIRIEKKLSAIPRPITPVKLFDKAYEEAMLSDIEIELIDFIRFAGTFTQVSVKQSLRLDSKTPVLSILCKACRKIGAKMPQHFEAVRLWSRSVSEDDVRWDGDLICSIACTIDGERLAPESGTAHYHTFVVHKELFQGFE